MTLTSEALRARRAEVVRRRRRRRRILGAALCVLAAAGVVAGVLVGRSVAHAKRATAARHHGHHGHHLRQPPTPAQLAAVMTARENAAIDRLLAHQPFIKVAGPERREIALTFDDGPGPFTPQVLDELNQLHVPGTFFEVGFMFRWFHGAATRAVQQGEAIGDHTQTHPHMDLLSPAAQTSQILDMTQSLRKYGGPFPRLWRPPYGSYNAATLGVLRQLHMLMVLWTTDTEDYRRPGVGAIVHRALAGAKPGAIILLHDAGGDRAQTVAALPLIVHRLQQQGYQLVTVPQLILDDPPLAPQALPTKLAGD